jgi:RHS repeat-associated protein
MSAVHTDNLNTPRQITDQNGNVVWQWGPDEPFGDTVPVQTSIVFNLRFPGQYYDQETGTHYNWFRDYDPTTGRYVESDPIGLFGGSYSTYSYVGGNPFSRTDPAGLYGPPQHMGITYDAMRAEGASVSQALDVAFGAAAWDFLPSYDESQDPSNANAHGMAMPGQSSADAIAGWNKVIDDNIGGCTQIGLERALHAGEDASAGGHHFKQDLPGSIGFEHITADWFPSYSSRQTAVDTARRIIQKYKAKCGCQGNK